MAFEIEFSEDAERQLRQISARDRTTILDGIEQQLTHEPNVPTRNRKLLRENPLSTWELRIGVFRIFYNVYEDALLVVIVAIGTKDRNRLFIDGMEIEL